MARREENLKRLIEVCRASSPASAYLAGDLGVRSFAEHVVDDTIAKHGRIDVLVNNAAITKHKQIWHLSADEVERVMERELPLLRVDDAGRAAPHAAGGIRGRS